MDKMPLTEHLGELRKRLIVSLIAAGIGFGVSFSYSEKLFYLLTFPLHSTVKFSFSNPFIIFETVSDTQRQLVFLAPAEAFWMHLKVAMVCGIVIALPVIFYELWKFISPGLKANEKKYVLPFVITVTFLFLAGAFFCFLIVLPFAMNFLITYKTENLKPMLSVGSYVDFCLKFILAFGAIFELPVVLVFLTRMGIVGTDTLAKNRKYAVLLAFVAAALLTPTPDAFNQILMAVPIILLYEVGILASRLLKTSPKKE